MQQATGENYRMKQWEMNYSNNLCYVGLRWGAAGTLGTPWGEAGAHNDHRAGAGVDIVREYEVQLGSLQIQMKFYLEKMKLR